MNGFAMGSLSQTRDVLKPGAGNCARRLTSIALIFLCTSTASTILVSCAEDESVNSPVPIVAPEFEQEWGGTGAGPGEFNFPLGLAVDETGALYVADLLNQRVQKFDAIGGFQLEWGPGNDPFAPGGITTEGDSLVFVTDIGFQRILVFDPEGNLLRSWGEPGGAEGQFDMPMSIAVDYRGDVYVADRNNRRIQKFGRMGDFKTLWEAGRAQSGNQFWGPHGLALASDGSLLMIEWHGFTVYQYSLDGVLLDEWGVFGLSEGKLANTYGIAADCRGRVYITDIDPPRIVGFRSIDRFQFQFGERGSTTGQLDVPWGVATGKNRNIYIADSERDVILRYQAN